MRSDGVSEAGEHVRVTAQGAAVAPPGLRVGQPRQTQKLGHTPKAQTLYFRGKRKPPKK